MNVLLNARQSAEKSPHDVYERVSRISDDPKSEAKFLVLILKEI
tara:strand:+ start:1753 stop:1884 length:132 start_codon:yes stop_codon:yes gene_type:complete